MAVNAVAGQPLGTHHPSAGLYVRIAVILFVMTGIEVLVYYLEPIRQLGLLPVVLILLSLAKFITVVGYYMHLKFDHKIFTGFFVVGLGLAGVVILTLSALFGVLLHAGAPIKSINTQAALAAAAAKGGGPAPAAVDPNSLGNVAHGKELFLSKGCTGCHMAPGIPGSATVGPNQAGYAARPTTAGGTLPNTPENTAKWLANPPAVKPGTLMPNLGLAPDEIKDLSAFLYSLK